MALACAAGLLVHRGVGAGAPHPIFALAGLVALALALRGVSVRRAVVLGAATGLCAAGPSLAFVTAGVELAGRGPALGAAVAAGVAGVHALRFVVAAAVAAALGRRRVPSGVALAAGWFAAEALDPAPLPWSLGAAALDLPWATAGADLGGAAVAALGVALAAGLVADGIGRRWHRAATPFAVSLLVGLTGYGMVRTEGVAKTLAAGSTLRVAAVPGERHLADRDRAPVAERRAAERAVREGARLVVLPESTLTLAFGADPDEAARAVFGGLGAIAVVGVATRAGPAGQASRNTVVIVDRAGRAVAARDKVRPFPIGEDDRWPLRSLGLDAPAGALFAAPWAGDVVVPLTASETLHVRTAICWEDLFPVGEGSPTAEGRLLVVASNDGWFAGTTAGLAHLTQARMRAVESRIAMVRAANLGASAIVDPLGRIVRADGARGEPLVADVQTARTTTWADRGGRGIARGGAIVVLLGATLARARPRRRARPLDHARRLSRPSAAS